MHVYFRPLVGKRRPGMANAHRFSIDDEQGILETPHPAEERAST